MIKKYQVLYYWVFFGLRSSIKIFIYLLNCIKNNIFVFYNKRKFDYKYFIPGIIFLIILTPFYLYLIMILLHSLIVMKELNNRFKYYEPFYKSNNIYIKQIGILLPMLLIGLSLLKIKIRQNLISTKKYIYFNDNFIADYIYVYYINFIRR